MASSEKEAHSFRIEKDSSGTVFFILSHFAYSPSMKLPTAQSQINLLETS